MSGVAGKDVRGSWEGCQGKPGRELGKEEKYCVEIHKKKRDSVDWTHRSSLLFSSAKTSNSSNPKHVPQIGK